MSKVEDLAEKAYPYPAWSNETTRAIDDLRRNAFIEGYHQAEKDLELTWKDAAEIVKIANILEIEWLNSTPWDGIRDYGFYEEVLKRFKERKDGSKR